ncbi:MAG: GNAT family N-acetyltransferase [Saonia sp.]
MDLYFGPVRLNEELEGILQLQKRNFPHGLSLEEKQKEGFVTVSHTLELLQRMNSSCPHIIAKDGDQVVGYVLCMHPKFANEIPILRPMFQEIDTIRPKKERYIIMGQVCIDKDYRKRGIFRKLYETMMHAIEPEFHSIITEVDVANTRSLQAHYAVGFKNLKKYLSEGQEWCLLILNGI